MKYMVPVKRVSYASTVITVEADSLAEAVVRAEREAEERDGETGKEWEFFGYRRVYRAWRKVAKVKPC